MAIVSTVKALMVCINLWTGTPIPEDTPKIVESSLDFLPVMSPICCDAYGNTATTGNIYSLYLSRDKTIILYKASTKAHLAHELSSYMIDMAGTYPRDPRYWERVGYSVQARYEREGCSYEQGRNQ